MTEFDVKSLLQPILGHEGVKGAFLAVCDEEGQMRFSWQGMNPAEVALLAALLNDAAVEASKLARSGL